MKKVLPLFLGVLLICGAAGCTKGDPPGPSSQPGNSAGPEPDQTVFYDCSETRDPDNITFTWRKPKARDTIYALNIAEEGIGKALSAGDTVIENDTLQIVSYEDEVNGILFLDGVGEYDLSFYLFPNWRNEMLDPDRKMVKENDRQILVHEYAYEEDYTVYLKVEDKFIRVSAQITDEAAAEVFFDYVNEHLHVAVIDYALADDKYGQLDLASAHWKEEPVDVAGWTFAVDLIADSCRNEGLKVRASSDIRGFNVDKSNAIDFYCEHRDGDSKGSVRYRVGVAADADAAPKETLMEVDTGTSVWKFTELEKGVKQAIVTTGAGKEYLAEAECSGLRGKDRKEVLKKNLMEHF